MSDRRTWALVAFAVISLGGLAAADVLAPRAPGLPGAGAERPAQPVRVTAIAFRPEDRVATYTGTIRPRHEVGLGFRLAGKIAERGVGIGDRVARGQVIARLDDTDARLELELAAAEAEAARVDLLRAEADVARTRALFAAGHVAQAALDRAESGAAEAAARADRADRAHALAGNRLDYTVLRSETDGIVTATPAETGQVVGAGQPVVTVAQAGAADVVFSLPEQDRARVGTAPARAELWGEEGRSYALSLRDISPDADPAGRTYRVRMTLGDPDAAAAFGRTVTVRLDLGAGAPVAAVPLAAVLNDGTGASVWRLDPAGARVERVPVEVEDLGDRSARIRGPLSDGDRIVSLGAHKVDPARPVRVVETEVTPEG